MIRRNEHHQAIHVVDAVPGIFNGIASDQGPHGMCDDGNLRVGADVSELFECVGKEFARLANRLVIWVSEVSRFQAQSPGVVGQ